MTCQAPTSPADRSRRCSCGCWQVKRLTSRGWRWSTYMMKRPGTPLGHVHDWNKR